MSSDDQENTPTAASEPAYRLELVLAATYMSFALTLTRHAITALSHGDKAQVDKVLVDMKNLEERVNKFSDNLYEMTKEK